MNKVYIILIFLHPVKKNPDYHNQDTGRYAIFAGFKSKKYQKINFHS